MSRPEFQMAFSHKAVMVSTPDVDNVAKFYLDALNGKAFVDDRQIVRLEATKRYGEMDAVDIRIKSCF